MHRGSSRPVRRIGLCWEATRAPMTGLSNRCQIYWHVPTGCLNKIKTAGWVAMNPDPLDSSSFTLKKKSKDL